MSTEIYTTGKKLTPENESRRRLRAHILAGGSPKEFTLGADMSPSAASKMLAGMGIKKVFVTDEEHALLKARRASK